MSSIAVPFILNPGEPGKLGLFISSLLTRRALAGMADEEGILIVKAQRIVLPDSILSGCLVVKNGKIVGIESGDGVIPWGSGAKVIEVVLGCIFLSGVPQGLVRGTSAFFLFI